MPTRRLAVSFECLNCSLAQLAG